MGEMLEQIAPPQQLLDTVLAIAVVAAPQDMVMGADDVSHRVDLQEAKLADCAQRVDRPSTGSQKTICRQPDPPRLPVADAQPLSMLELSWHGRVRQAGFAP